MIGVLASDYDEEEAFVSLLRSKDAHPGLPSDGIVDFKDVVDAKLVPHMTPDQRDGYGVFLRLMAGACILDAAREIGIPPDLCRRRMDDFCCMASALLPSSFFEYLDPAVKNALSPCGGSVEHRVPSFQSAVDSLGPFSAVSDRMAHAWLTEVAATARGVARPFYYRYQKLFSANAIDKDDLCQEALVAACSACKDYDPSKTDLDSFTGLCVRRRLITILKSISRKNNVYRTAHEPLYEASSTLAQSGIPVSSAFPAEHLGILGSMMANLTPLERRALKLYCQTNTTNRNDKKKAHVSTFYKRKRGKVYDNAIQRVRKKIKEAMGIFTPPATGPDRVCVSATLQSKLRSLKNRQH